MTTPTTPAITCYMCDCDLTEPDPAKSDVMLRAAQAEYAREYPNAELADAATLCGPCYAKVRLRMAGGLRGTAL